MVPNPINEDVLNGVDETRRDFLRKVIVGTAFVTPLMASFSMDGLLINAAEANSVCNMTDSGPSHFKAHLSGTATRARGRFQGHLTCDNTLLAYKLRVSNNMAFQDAALLLLD
ncbi:hypothetical protein BH20PSE1_BH20PSE1_22870 [soil metagenome]